MKEKIFLSDINGTLTVGKQAISGELADTIVEFAKKFRFGVITGSSMRDLADVMPEELLVNPNIDFWCNNGNTLYRLGEPVMDKGNYIDFNLLNPVLDDVLESCPFKYEKSYPRHRDLKSSSSINFTMLGRPIKGHLTQEERDAYEAWDAEYGQRQWVVEYLTKLLPEYNISLGGQISIDIVKKGCDKAQIVDFYKDDYKICLFGDRIGKFGNDNSIAHAIAEIGGCIYAVSGPDMTMRIMQALMKVEE